jgi:CRISPR/Cas system CSM-associated protein Csm3 (group 7 of RAMP superfamily)
MIGLTHRAKRAQRVIRRRIIIRGTLLLATPTHLGNGDSEGATDMTLQRDSISDQALLTGASIAGALRSYLRSYHAGWYVKEQKASDKQNFDLKGEAELLFGGLKGDDDGYQSPLVVCDAYSVDQVGNPVIPLVELRDGVKINAQTRTPADKTKYDLELLAAGTRFGLQFELNVPQHYTDAQETRMCSALALALHALEQGEIGIGMKKRRGFGRCTVEQWQVWKFNLADHTDLLRWLVFERDYGNTYSVPGKETSDIASLLELPAAIDRRKHISLTATFTLEGSLLIRAGQDEAVLGPDVIHLRAHQPNDSPAPVISGTSLAGVLRHRAERIANTLVPESGPSFVERLFGTTKVGRSGGHASRVVVHESIIHGARTDLIQNRVSIDRFTGGAYDGALFNEQPVFARPETRVSLTIELHDPKPGEVGMLLLLLKDLWTGDLPVGGESSIGRGRLRGIDAKISNNGQEMAVFAANGQHVSLTKGDRKTLNDLVTELAAVLAQPVKERVYGV